MKALFLDRYDGPLDLRETPDPACPPDGVIVALRACGVCRSDHHAFKGADPDVVLPHVMGHELAGEVIEVGPDVRGFVAGDRVTAPFVLSCGHCPDCRSGRATVCETQEVVGFTRPGAFAERIAVPRADFNLVRLPDGLGYVEAAGMGCRVTTAFRALTERGGIAPGEWVAVHGCGGVGLSAVMIAAALGARVLAVDVSGEALAMAERLGATEVLTAGEDTGAAVREATGGGADLSIDALGITETFDASLRGLRKLGRHVQVGMPLGRHAEVTLPLLELIYARQISVIGSRGMAASGFPPLLDMVSAGRLDIAALVTARIPLSGVEATLRAMDDFSGLGVTVVALLRLEPVTLRLAGGCLAGVTAGHHHDDDGNHDKGSKADDENLGQQGAVWLLAISGAGGSDRQRGKGFRGSLDGHGRPSQTISSGTPGRSSPNSSSGSTGCGRMNPCRRSGARRAFLRASARQASTARGGS